MYETAGFFPDKTQELRGEVIRYSRSVIRLEWPDMHIWVLDRPLNDRGAQITPSRMQASLVIMSHDAHFPPTLPCDADGNPT